MKLINNQIIFLVHETSYAYRKYDYILKFHFYLFLTKWYLRSLIITSLSLKIKNCMVDAQIANILTHNSSHY